MKKKFLSIFLAPLFVVPIALSSCSSSYRTNTPDQQFFVYKSQNYQLEIHPYIPARTPEGEASCTMADISVVFNHPDTAEFNQQIYIDSLTINDSYTNPDNGYTYKTNIVTFCNDKNKVLTDDGKDAVVEYVIGNFSVSANIFNPFLSINQKNEADIFDDFNVVHQEGEINRYVSPIDSSYDGQYLANFSIRNSNINVETLSTKDWCDKPDTRYSLSSHWINQLDGPITFSNRLTTIDEFDFDLTSDTNNITLPDSLKRISYGAFGGECFYQSTFIIPQSVEIIGDYAFSALNAPSTSSSSSSSTTTTKNVIKVPSKFESDAERIFGTKPDDSSSSSSSSSTSSSPNTWTNYDIQFY